MNMDDVIQVKVPAPDSQYRLRCCPACQSDNVAYIQTVHDGGLWHGRCFDCEFTGDGAAVRHDAQVNWNKEVRGMRTNKDCPCKDCPDRYTACSDHCRKPEFLAWKEEKAKIVRARMANGICTGYTVDQIRKNRRGR